MVVFVVDGTHWTRMTRWCWASCATSNAPVVLAVNKIDNVKGEKDLLLHSGGWVSR